MDKVKETEIRLTLSAEQKRNFLKLKYTTGTGLEWFYAVALDEGLKSLMIKHQVS